MSELHLLFPLNSLRAFEAAERHESFQRAAQELRVTPGAVAHQVRLLEERLDIQLFRRHANGIAVTASGKRYAESVRDALAALSSATRQLVQENRLEHVVTISAIPSYVTRWLMPRLPDFRKRHHEIEVRLQAQVQSADLFRESVDVSIRLGTGPYPGLLVDDLQAETYRAYASPSYIAQRKIDVVSDLYGVTLLHDDYEARIPDQITWERWLTAVGAQSRRRLQGHWFSHTYLTLEAAIAGQGVAVASGPMVDRAVELGQLVPLLSGVSVPGPYRFRLLRLPGAEERPAVKAFCEWMLAQKTRPVEMALPPQGVEAKLG
ncbi:LysR substrate-binding domain-containing protein [Paraburkholderia bryophila]|uniref:LysR substrate-binding domain-containing protein n=1 Tax=Paraburkholderia bryophila TaxID=420952 RepID=UPI00234A4891|nr:LysR substrate-binding domain-containing protein [Paraburkholderia bryophila]WCM23148.1 LysR substrate-binding domain-containing protein [Paraburkholderia bryophila]